MKDLILCNKNVILTLQIIVFALNEELVDKKKANIIQYKKAKYEGGNKKGRR